MHQVDLLLHARWVIPISPAGEVLEHAAVAVRDGRIVEILPSDQARHRYAPEQSVERPAHALLPGFVNAHTHAAMTLLRGLADDLSLMRWLQEHIWPAERQWMSPTYVRDGTALAVAEMLLGGTTCFNDMYFFPDVVARTSAECGIRACVGMIVVDMPTAWAESEAEYFSKGLEVHDAYRAHPLITTAFAPHAPYSVSDSTLGKVRRLSDQLDVPVHVHLHESDDEVRQGLASEGRRPLARFRELGLLNPSLMAVHMTQLDPAEIVEIATTGVHVVHCPESNFKLASGFCPVSELLAAGVNVALGTDGAASNNDLDMLGELRTASLLAKGVAHDPTAVSAHQALQMATLNGARALGLADDIGSIEPGKWADLACIDFDAPATQPVYEPASQIVYSATRDQISDVWVAGRHLVAEGALTRLDAAAAIARAQSWRERIGPAREPALPHQGRRQ